MKKVVKDNDFQRFSSIVGDARRPSSARRHASFVGTVVADVPRRCAKIAVCAPGFNPRYCLFFHQRRGRRTEALDLHDVGHLVRRLSRARRLCFGGTDCAGARFVARCDRLVLLLAQRVTSGSRPSFHRNGRRTLDSQIVWRSGGRSGARCEMGAS